MLEKRIFFPSKCRLADGNWHQVLMFNTILHVLIDLILPTNDIFKDISLIRAHVILYLPLKLM